MRWVFEENIIEEDVLNDFKSFLYRMDIPFTLLKMVPFTKDLTAEKLDKSEPMVALGCYDFVYKIKSLEWEPGVWINDNFNYKVWSKYWNIVNKDANVYTLENVPFQEKPFFIRPIADDKTFTGQVMDWDQFSEVIENIKLGKNSPSFYHLTKETEVIISSKKKIIEEYRVLCVNGKAITGSLYKRGTIGIRQNVDSDIKLFSFVDEMCSKWTPADVFIMDIALIDGHYAVMEMGCFNAAGLYKLDVQRIIMSIENLKGI